MASKLRCDHQRAESVVHREGLNRHTYFRCPSCGKEWTQTETVADLSDVVTSEEVLEVHEQLETGKSLKDLIP